MPPRTPKNTFEPDKIDLSNTRLVGYARVSTEDQNLNLQLDALRKAGVMEDNLHVEKVSGASKRRWHLDLAIKDLQPGDTFVVWKIDRIGRNARQLHDVVDRVYKAGAQLKSLQEDFDFTTFTGEFILGILALVAQLERRMISHRTKAGMEAMEKRGRHLGRPAKMTPARRKTVERVLRKTGNMTKAAEAIGISRVALHQYYEVERTGKKIKIKKRK